MQRGGNQVLTSIGDRNHAFPNPAELVPPSTGIAEGGSQIPPRNSPRDDSFALDNRANVRVCPIEKTRNETVRAAEISPPFSERASANGQAPARTP